MFGNYLKFIFVVLLFKLLISVIIKDLVMVDYRNYIELNLDVMLGKLVIKGIRIMVEFLFWKLVDGYDLGEILEMYFYFKLEDILVVIMYVVLVIENEEVIKVV